MEGTNETEIWVFYMVVGKTALKSVWGRGGYGHAALHPRSLHDVQVRCCDFLTKSQFIAFFSLIY